MTTANERLTEAAGLEVSCGTTRSDPLALLRFIPAGKEGHPRSACDSCDLLLWSQGGYRVPGLKGLYCSLVCIECAIAAKTGQRKKIAGAPIGSGARLLAYLKTEAPELYARLLENGARDAGARACLECGAKLDGKRSDSDFCSHAHQMRFRRRSQQSQTDENRPISRHTRIGKQGLTDAHFPGSTDTLIARGDAL